MGRQGKWRISPALAVASLALFVALSGSVYAAKKPRLDGRAIRAKSIPGNRLKPHTVSANRLRPGFVRSLRKAARGGDVPLTGAEINELTLGEVPFATRAGSAARAQSAVDAQTALNAVNAVDARTVNGHGAGCLPGTRPFAGACWQSSANKGVAAPVAARRCADSGGALPAALQLAAFAEEPGVNLDPGDEWSGEITNVSGPGVYGVVTVTSLGEIDFALSTKTHAYRCVIPLVR